MPIPYEKDKSREEIRKKLEALGIKNDKLILELIHNSHLSSLKDDLLNSGSPAHQNYSNSSLRSGTPSYTSSSPISMGRSSYSSSSSSSLGFWAVAVGVILAAILLIYGIVKFVF